MIHIVTVHFRCLTWIPLQYAHIKANTSQFKLWYFIDEVPFDPWPFDFQPHFKSSSGIDKISSRGHAKKLNKLVYETLASEPDDDIVLFLDGDSFPISPINKFIDESLSSHDFCAVVREENATPFPHPSFAFCKLGFWRKHKLSWDLCGWDTGNCLFRYFKRHNIEWKRVPRSHSLCDSKVVETNPPPGCQRRLDMLFGIYGGLVYHHGAGFRRVLYKRPVKTAAYVFNTIKEIGTHFDETFISQHFKPLVRAEMKKKGEDWKERRRKERKERRERDERARKEIEREGKFEWPILKLKE